jgi:ADP-ribosylglycohydrolase
MALSNTGGAGRGTSDGDIIGTIINHGKKKYWARGGAHHYHCTLQAGENTLEGEMARLSSRSMTKGDFDVARMRQEYIDFMTTPGSHNDAYASTFHRMFFANRERGLPLEECPDNDHHNVDTIDGLIMPIPVILGSLDKSEAESVELARNSVRVTRKSKRVEEYIPVLVKMLRGILSGRKAVDVAQEFAQQLYGQEVDTGARDPVVACYLDPNFQSLIHFLAKYDDFRDCALANANAGGENVHRGLVLGALLGAQIGANGIPEDLKLGLNHSQAIANEIDAFVSARVKLSFDTDWAGHSTPSNIELQ